jgi:hypothetical protein
MAIITNYATLKTAIADYLARDDLTTFIPNFVQNTENKLRRTLNLRNEETDLSITISIGVADVPTDFKALKFAYYDSTPSQLLQWVPIEELIRDYPDRSAIGIPRVISRYAEVFWFGPVPADGSNIYGSYYAKQDPLETTDGSWYVTNAPEVLLYGALMEAAPFIHDDPRLATWQQLFTDALSTLRDEQRNAEHSHGQLIQRIS